MAGQGASAPAIEREGTIDAGEARLPAIVGMPASARGVVVFAHGSGSSRLSPRNAQVAAKLREAGLATVLLDLLTGAEAVDRRNVFDIQLLASRLQAAARWARAQPETRDLPVGLFGASTGAAAALVAAADDPEVAAVVSRGGRPDLAGEALARVKAPTLLIVGERDEQVLELNRQAQRTLAGPSKLEIIPGATHLFDEPGTLEQAARFATDWFAQRLGRNPAPQGSAQTPGSTSAGAPARGATPAPILGFRDRAEAGELLARALEVYRGRDCVVLGLPRGGVEVGAVIARRLGATLDVLLVRKLPAPPQPELALGAVADGAKPVRVLDKRRIDALGLSDDDINRIADEQLEEIRRRERLYRGARPAADVRGRLAIVVDDGVATGSTAEAALRAVRAREPAELVFAAPVGAPEAIESLARHCDRVVCLLQPAGFWAVGVYYADFDQIDDTRVMELLRAQQV
jgi:putative phosphoribosyl transferase